MHFTEPVYRNPYWPTWPLLEEARAGEFDPLDERGLLEEVLLSDSLKCGESVAVRPQRHSRS